MSKQNAKPCSLAFLFVAYQVSVSGLFPVSLRKRTVSDEAARVAQRVKQGGHNIPEDVIRRRFTAGMNNSERLYAPVVDAWALYDNAGSVPVLIDWSERP